LQPTTQSTFAKHALASGLVSQSDLDDVTARLEMRVMDANGEPSTENSPAPDSNDENMADLLVAAGRLNRFQAAQLLAGHTKLNLGPYRIVDAIGQGGMGQVFRAEHSLLGRTVAVKVLPKSKSTPEAIDSFTREIRAQAALDHENLVRALDAGHDGNVYFLVCEYVPGADLRRYVRDRGPLGMAEAATIISQAARGLEHAHNCGLIHRDVKPANLLVTPDGHTKVSDLGLAGSLAPTSDQQSGDGDPRAGKVVGTADYLSPEHIISPLSIGVASDIYSLGCTLYYAVTGKVPYPGGNARDKARRHCEDTPLHPRLLNPSLSEPFVEVIAAMMEKDPAKRIASAAHVVERLRPWAGESVSSPRDPDEARRTREGDFDLDSGAGELTDTSASFEFELAVPPPPERRDKKPAPAAPPAPLRLAVATPSLLARPMVAMRPVPARPIVSVPPIRRLPMAVLAASPAARSARRWWATPLVLGIAAAAIVGVIVAVALKMTGD
jgi:serine/threonine protein kinase